VFEEIGMGNWKSGLALQTPVTIFKKELDFPIPKDI
jgi:hypothetical protein